MVGIVRGRAPVCRWIAGASLVVACAIASARGGDPPTEEEQAPSSAAVYHKAFGPERSDATDEAELEKRVATLAKGESSRSARNAALKTVPLDKLAPEHRRRAEDILESTSLFRELPALEFEVDPHVYDFFCEHPDVAVSIWRVMKISKFDMWQTGKQKFEADSGDGSLGVIDVAYRSPKESVVLCEGVFSSPLLVKPIKAHGLFHLMTLHGQRPDGTPVTRHQGRLFVSFPSQAVSTVAKVISPVSYGIIDRNFQEVSLFLHMMTVAMRRQPGWIEHVAARLEGVLEPRKTELVDLTARVYVHERRRREAHPETETSQAPLDDSTPPRVAAKEEPVMK